MEDMKESLYDLRAEIAIERRTRKEEKEKTDKRILALEDRFAGFGTTNTGNGVPGGWGITAVIGDKEAKCKDMEQLAVETWVKKAMESVVGVKRIYFDDVKNVVALVDFESPLKCKNFVKKQNSIPGFKGLWANKQKDEVERWAERRF